MNKGILIIYKNFNLPVDCIRFIYDIIINDAANTIINAWYKKIQYKITLLRNIINLHKYHSLNGRYVYYSPFTRDVAKNFYKASRVINRFDDIDTWLKYFNRLNNFFKYVPNLNFLDKNVFYSYNALINFKTRVYYFQ